MSQQPLIKPSIGKSVLYYEYSSVHKRHATDPSPAQITRVRSNYEVDLVFFAEGGKTVAHYHVPLKQSGAFGRKLKPKEGYCEWHPNEVLLADIAAKIDSPPMIVDCDNLKLDPDMVAGVFRKIDDGAGD